MIDRSDIHALLEDADEQLGRVREMYDESLRDQEVPIKPKARIKT
jgi:hypothetical protein